MTTERLAVVFVARARREIATAAAWWRVNRPSAPRAIVEELRSAMSLLRDTPDLGSSVRDARLSGVRRLFLERIDYHLYYRLSTRPRRLRVLAFWHARRMPPAL